MEEIDLDEVYEAKVVSLKDFGAFCELIGKNKQGLLHKSNISEHRVDKVEDVLERGEKVFVKVISMNEGKRKNNFF